jgi:hypothetical protein
MRNDGIRSDRKFLDWLHRNRAALLKQIRQSQLTVEQTTEPSEDDRRNRKDWLPSTRRPALRRPKSGTPRMIRPLYESHKLSSGW